MVLDNERDEVRFAVLELLTFCFEYAFGLFKTKTVQDCEIILDYLLCTMPNTSF